MTDEEFAALPPGDANSHQRRELPADLEAEAQLLCCCTIDNGITFKACAQAGITEASFHNRSHALFFRALAHLSRTHSDSFEAHALILVLRQSGDLDQVGGHQKVVEISSLLPTTLGARNILQQVRGVEIRRTLAILGDKLAEQSRNGVTVEELRKQFLDQVPEVTRTAPIDTDWPDPISADLLSANPPKTPPVLIEGILYAGGTMLLSGPSKAHKTFSALDAGIAIASGAPWLGFATVQHPILYLNLELQDFATNERVEKISSARGTKPPSNLHLWNLRGRDVTLLTLTAKLPEMIKRLGAKVVCIDPHYKISSVSGMEENSNDDQGKLLTLMEGLCGRNGAALILTHHFAKGDASNKNAIDRASGGGVFARWGDVMLTFTPHEEQDAMTIEMSLRNFAPVQPFVVRWEYPRWIRDAQLDPMAMKKASTKAGTFQEKHTAAQLFDVLGDQLLTASEWERKSGFSRATFYRKRQELVEAKRVSLSGNCYRKC